jgi:hypothetical protein
MKNIFMFNGFSPLGIRISGSGEFVTKELSKLEDTFADARADHLEEIRQDEHNTR